MLVLLLPKLTLAYTTALSVDSNTTPINAIEGTIMVPKEITITQIYDGNSTILFWVDKPIFDKDKNTIRFSGFTPGGFQGKHFLFSILGNFTEQDLNKFNFSGVRALGNDGLGTQVPVKLLLSSSTIEKDTVPPEIFIPIISKSNVAFDNSYFLSFIAQDKGVGIDHYEYATTRLFGPSVSDWKKAESPLSLTQDESSQRIFIKAVDKSGNERISTIFAPNYYEYTLIRFIIGVLIICVLSYISRMFL